MTVLLLFLILAVLIYMAGLLPGVFKVVGIVVGAVLVVFAGGIYGWTTVVGVAASAIAVAAIAVWITVQSLSNNRKIKTPKSAQYDMEDQLARVNAAQKKNREDEQGPHL